MRAATFVIASLLTLAGDRVLARPTGRICFVRVADHGSAKRRPVRILGEQDGRARQLVELGPGDKACARVSPGKWSLEARSAPPDAPKASDPNACRSFPLVVEVNERAPITLSVHPLGSGPTDICGWELE